MKLTTIHRIVPQKQAPRPLCFYAGPWSSLIIASFEPHFKKNIGAILHYKIWITSTPNGWKKPSFPQNHLHFCTKYDFLIDHAGDTTCNASTLAGHHIINIDPILLLLDDKKRSSLPLSIASTPAHSSWNLTDYYTPNIRTFLCLRPSGHAHAARFPIQFRRVKNDFYKKIFLQQVQITWLQK